MTRCCLCPADDQIFYQGLAAIDSEYTVVGSVERDEEVF